MEIVYQYSDKYSQSPEFLLSQESTRSEFENNSVNYSNSEASNYGRTFLKEADLIIANSRIDHVQKIMKKIEEANNNQHSDSEDEAESA